MSLRHALAVEFVRALSQILDRLSWWGRPLLVLDLSVIGLLAVIAS